MRDVKLPRINESILNPSKFLIVSSQSSKISINQISAAIKRGKSKRISMGKRAILIIVQNNSS